MSSVARTMRRVRVYYPPRAGAALAVLGGLLAVALLLAVGQGTVQIAPGQALSILANAVGVDLPWQFDATQQVVLLSIRLPRAVLGVLVGAALAVAGVALQGLFRNPLADPGLIGVSTGAALAAASTIVFGNAVLAIMSPDLLRHLLPLAGLWRWSCDHPGRVCHCQPRRADRCCRHAACGCCHQCNCPARASACLCS